MNDFYLSFLIAIIPVNTANIVIPAAAVCLPLLVPAALPVIIDSLVFFVVVSFCTVVVDDVFSNSIVVKVFLMLVLVVVLVGDVVVFEVVDELVVDMHSSPMHSISIGHSHTLHLEVSSPFTQ